MALFIDTSAVLAVLDPEEEHHHAACGAWAALQERNEALFSSNYVLVETVALLQRRVGLLAVRALQAEMAPLFHVHWVDEALHERALAALLAANRRRLSLVDWVSFEVMRRLGLDTAFAFDADFTDQGFRCVP